MMSITGLSKFSTKIWVLFIVLAIFCLPAAALPSFGYVVKNHVATVYANPSLESRIVGQLNATTPIADEEGGNLDKNWVYHAPHVKGVTAVGWVRRVDLSTSKEMKKVLGCWPVQQLEAPEGEQIFNKITFLENGDAKIIDTSDTPWPATTYIDGSLVFLHVKSKSKLAPFGIFFEFEANSMKLLPNGEAPTKQKNFELSRLVGCKGVTISK